MPDDPTMAALQHRLARLEKRSRLLTVLVPVAVVAAALIGMARPAAVPDVLEARRIRLLDADGKVRAALRMQGGGPGLHLMDEDGNVRLSAWHDAEQTALYIRNAAGDVRVGTALFSHGGAGYALHGPGSKGAAVLSMSGDGSPRVTFYDAEGKVTYNAAPEAEE